MQVPDFILFFFPMNISNVLTSGTFFNKAYHVQKLQKVFRAFLMNKKRDCTFLAMKNIATDQNGTRHIRGGGKVANLSETPSD